MHGKGENVPKNWSGHDVAAIVVTANHSIVKSKIKERVRDYRNLPQNLEATGLMTLKQSSLLLWLHGL